MASERSLDKRTKKTRRERDEKEKNVELNLLRSSGIWSDFVFSSLLFCLVCVSGLVWSFESEPSLRLASTLDLEQES